VRDVAVSGSDLSSEEEELINRLRMSVVRLYRRLRTESLGDLTPSQASALAMARRLDRATLGELAAAEHVQPPSMTRLIASLEAAGLVERFADDTDRRIWRIRVTELGLEEIGRIQSTKNALLARRISALPPEAQANVAGLTALLDKLAER
jgi:DNA-binding MarR family transcriptional regulator